MHILSLLVWAFVALGVLIVNGCSDKSGVSLEKGDVKPVVAVLGQTLAKADVERKVRMLETIIRHHSPKMPAQAIEGAVDSFYRRYPATFVQTVVLGDYAAQKKIVVAEDTLKEFQGKAYRRFKGKKDRNFDDLCKSLGEYGDDFRKQVRSEALARAVRDYWTKLYPTNIPDSYVDQQLRNFALYNENVIKTNALIYARATNVWEQLRAGADFGEMAAKYSDLEDERASKGVWGAVDSRQIGDEVNICHWGKKLEIGKFSPPIEGDNGLMIMRLDDRLDSDQEFHISRIYFQLAESRTPAPREKILAAAYEKYADRLFAEKYAELRQAAKPVFNEMKKGKEKTK